MAAAVESSTADATEILWYERRRGRSGHNVVGVDAYLRIESLAEARVRVSGRDGCFRVDLSAVHDGPARLEWAVRQAISQARLGDPSPNPDMPGSEETLPAVDDLFDRVISELDENEAQRRLAELLGRQGAGILEWSSGHVAIANSRGLRRSQGATAVTLQVRSSDGPGAGFATGSARSWHRLDAERILLRARKREVSQLTNELPPPPFPLLLSPEATIVLLDQLSQLAFSARAYAEGTSFLRQHLGVQVFDRQLNLLDTPGDPSGMPFPFDLEGRARRELVLVEKGVPRSATLDSRSAAQVGLEPTGHGLAPFEAYPLHLCLPAGDLEEQELLQAVDGGLWLGRLENIECFDPERVRLRAHARGVRRVRGGELCDALPELVWEDSVLRVFSSLSGIGTELVCRASRDGFLGATRAPAVVIADVTEILEARSPGRRDG